MFSFIIFQFERLKKRSKIFNKPIKRSKTFGNDDEEFYLKKYTKYSGKNVKNRILKCFDNTSKIKPVLNQYEPNFYNFKKGSNDKESIWVHHNSFFKKINTKRFESDSQRNKFFFEEINKDGVESFNSKSFGELSIKDLIPFQDECLSSNMEFNLTVQITNKPN